MKSIDDLDEAERKDLEELMHRLFRESMKLHSFFHHGLSQSVSGEMAVMRTLLDAGESLSPTELSKRTNLSATRISNVLKTLEQKDWIVRTSNTSSDRRRQEVSISEHGLKVAEAKKKAHHDMGVLFLSELGKEDAKSLLHILERTQQILASEEFKDVLKQHKDSHREG